MDKVEKTRLVACRLPRRPNLSRGRDGSGGEYWTLSYRHPDKYGPGDCKERLYLGRLTPLQVLAVRQAIADAWPQRPKHSEIMAELGARCHQAYRVAEVLARRCGYTLHGYQLRRMRKMNSPIRETIELLNDPDAICRWAAGMSRATGMGPKHALVEILELLRFFVLAMLLYNTDVMLKAKQRGKQGVTAAKRILASNGKLVRKLTFLNYMMQKFREEIAKDALHAN